MSIFKKRILHIIVAALSFFTFIFIVAVPVEYYNYYYGTYYSYSLIEYTEGIAGGLLFFVLIPLIWAVLMQFPFMQKMPFLPQKLIGGLMYIFCGFMQFMFSVAITAEWEGELFQGVWGIMVSLVVLVFGILLVSTRRPAPSYQQPQPVPGYNPAPGYQAPVGQPAPGYQAPVAQPTPGQEGLYYELKGAQKVLRVYDDRVTLEIIKNARAVLTQNWFGGTKEIYYSDMLGIQYKEAGDFILGYIQFETASSRGGDNFGSENSWTFDYRTVPNEKAKEVEHFVRDKMRKAKQPQAAVQQKSAAEELLNWKQLLDAGVISQEEFDAKKKELLGK